MRTRNKRKRRLVFRSFKGCSLGCLRKKIGSWVVWDCIGCIQENHEFKMYAQGFVKAVSGQRQVTIWVPGMFGGGMDRSVKPSELFLHP